MYKVFFLTVCLLLSPLMGNFGMAIGLGSASNAQTIEASWEWSSVLSNRMNIESDDMGTDSQGNSYIVGTTEGRPDIKDSSVFIGDQSQLGKNLYVAKFNPNGNLVWFANAGGNGDDYGKGIIVDEDSNGNVLIFVTGQLETRDVDQNQALIQYNIHFGDELNYTSNATVAPFVAKISSAGAWEWAKLGKGLGMKAGMRDIAFDGDNSVYIGGRYSESLAFSSVDKSGNEVWNSVSTMCNAQSQMGFVAAFTTAGHHRFTQQTGGCGTWVNAIAVRDDSKLFVGGGYWNVGTIAHQTYTVTHYAYPNGATSPVLEEAFIATIEPDTGDWDWIRRVTGFNKDRINDIVVDSEHDALIAGNHLNNVSFETPGADCSPQSTAYTTNQCLRIAAGGDFDMFVAKISSDGDWMFADSFGGVNADGYGSTDFLQTITVDSNDNMYVMGSFTNNLILGTDYLPNTPQGPNYFVAKAANDPILAADGVTQELDWMWACQAGRVDNYGTEPFYGATYKRYAGLALDPQGIPIITGFFENSVKFDQDYISQTPNGEALKSTYIAKLSTTCAIPQPTPQHITVSNIYRDDVRLLSKFTNYSKEQVTDFNFAGKLVTVSVKSYGSYGVAITAEASARHHGSDYGVPMKGTLSKLTIVDAGDDISSQALLDATYPIDDFSDYGITLVSVSSDSFSKNENFTEKANTLQELIESGIFPIFEGEEKNGDSSDEEVEKARKPIKGYVYIRKTNRGVDTGEPTEMGVVAWGVKEAGDGNGYVVDDVSHSLEGIKSEWATQVDSEDITDVCHTLLTTMNFLSEEDACISVLVEDLEKNVSQDGGGECYIASDPVKDQFYLGKESRNDSDDAMNISASVKRVGDFSKFCAPSTEPDDEPNRGSQNCGTDIALSDLSVSTDMPFYEVGDDVTVTYAINCAVEPTNYTLKTTTTRASNNEVISVQEYSIVASSLSEAIDEIHIDLDADVYCVEVYLTEANYPQLDDVSTCFVVSSQASSSGGGSLSGIGMFASLSTLLIVAFIGRRIRIDN
jgi:hypothetical protein